MSHIADLCNGAFFNACWSYRYSKTSSTQRTNIITLWNIAFCKRNKKITNLTKIHDEIGYHSIWSGAVMTMCLKKVAPYTIMLQGRWCSDAFLRHIRSQVTEFSQGVSELMIFPDTYAFYTVPDSTIEYQDENLNIPGNRNSLTSSYNGRSATRSFARHHIFEWDELGRALNGNLQSHDGVERSLYSECNASLSPLWGQGRRNVECISIINPICLV